MTQYIFVFLFFVVAIGGMAFALHFSQYKKRPTGCCGGGHCTTNSDEGSGQYSCYNEKLDFVEKHHRVSRT